MKNLTIGSEKEEIEKLWDTLSHDPSIIPQIKTDLCNVLSLCHGSLEIWSKSRGIKVFKIEACQFLSNCIEKIMKNFSQNNDVDFHNEHSSLERVQSNRNIKFVQLCKELLEFVNEHGNVVGGLIQACVASPRTLCSNKVF